LWLLRTSAAEPPYSLTLGNLGVRERLLYNQSDQSMRSVFDSANFANRSAPANGVAALLTKTTKTT